MGLLDDFRNEPTKRSHPSYKDSLFTFTAPEYSTAEVLLGSLYRKLLLGKHDNEIDLESIEQLVKDIGNRWQQDDLATLLLAHRGGIASPIRSGQRGAVPYKQLMPLVPPIARYACVLGKKRNRWFPGDLALQVIGTGLGPERGNPFVAQLQGSLAVTNEDSVLSRFITRELDALVPPDPIPTLTLDASETRAYRGTPSSNGRSPAEQCCQDLDVLLPLKSKLTRRQWTVLLEALLRLGLPTHVLWACHANIAVWKQALQAADGNPPPNPDTISSLVWTSHRNNSFLETGRDSVPAIKQLIEQYVIARFGINIILYRLQEANVPWQHAFIGHDPATNQTAPAALHAFLKHINYHRTGIDATNAGAWLRKEVAQLSDRNLPLLRCASGFTKNQLEFVRHSLGQIEAQDAEQRSYDQSYLLSNAMGGSRRSRLWPVQPGPGMLILLAHSATSAAHGMPVSLDDFRSHLGNYGLTVPPNELLHGKLTLDLQKLGLLVDSPDAAGGRLLVGPFFEKR